MDGPRDYHTKRSKSERDKYHMILLTCGIQNMTQKNISMKQNQTHRHREHTVVASGKRLVNRQSGRLRFKDAS